MCGVTTMYSSVFDVVLRSVRKAWPRIGMSPSSGTLFLVLMVVFLGQAADDEGIAVAHGGRGLGLALADRRIALAEAGDARHHAEDMARDEAVAADPRRDLQGHADIHILHLLRNAVDARQGDRGEDRQRVAGDDLGGRSALRGDPRLGDDAAVALEDLGVERGLEAGAGQMICRPGLPRRDELAGLERRDRRSGRWNW